MRHLRRYIANEYGRRLHINGYGITAAEDMYIYVYGILIYVITADHSTYSYCYRKLYHGHKIGFALRRINIAFPYITIYDNVRGFRIQIKIDENAEISIKKCYNPS